MQNGKKRAKMKKIASKWTAEVLTDNDGEVFIEFSEEFLREVDWKEGDNIEWIDNHDGSFTLKKKDKEKYMMASEIDTKEGRKWLRGVLKMHETTVTFTKKDGSERKMICTLAESKIPSEKTPKNAKKTQSQDAIAVFDIEKQDWRSFRWDSVTRVDFTLGK